MDSRLRQVIIFLCLVGLSFGVASGQERPNIVMILVDDMGIGDLNPVRTPKCAELAMRGTRLNLYAHQNCMPTRAALMTGVYPHRMGLHEVWPTPIEPGIPADRKLISEYLSEAGYRCGIFGKWHLGWKETRQWPTRRGFSEFIGLLGGHINSYGTQQLGTPYFDGSIGHDHHGMHDLQWNEVPLYTSAYSTELFSRGAVNFIERTHQRNSPFFLYVPFNAPHSPYSAPRRYVEQALATGEFDVSVVELLDEVNGIMMADRNDRVAIYETSRLLYAAMLLALDDAVMQIYGKLEELNIADNTLFVFASDNGVSYVRDPAATLPAAEPVGSSGQYRGFKGLPYEGGVRVANFVVWPNRIQAQQQISSNVWIGDLPATFMQASGEAIPPSFDGGSLMGAIDRNEDVMRRFGGRRILPYLRVQPITNPARPELVYFASAGVVAGNRKYIRTNFYNSDGVASIVTEELYDLRRDPSEQRNLASNPVFTQWLSTSRREFDAFGGDAMLKSLPVIPRSGVWAVVQRTLDFVFPDNGRVLETDLP